MRRFAFYDHEAGDGYGGTWWHFRSLTFWIGPFSVSFGLDVSRIREKGFTKQERSQRVKREGEGA